VSRSRAALRDREADVLTIRFGADVTAIDWIAIDVLRSGDGGFDPCQIEAVERHVVSCVAGQDQRH
jgi:hypothetical protein